MSAVTLCRKKYPFPINHTFVTRHSYFRRANEEFDGPMCQGNHRGLRAAKQSGLPALNCTFTHCTLQDFPREGKVEEFLQKGLFCPSGRGRAPSQIRWSCFAPAGRLAPLCQALPVPTGSHFNEVNGLELAPPSQSARSFTLLELQILLRRSSDYPSHAEFQILGVGTRTCDAAKLN